MGLMNTLQDPMIRIMIDDSVETDYESLMKEEKEKNNGRDSFDGDSLKSSINNDSSSLSPPPPPIFAAGKQEPPLLTSQVHTEWGWWSVTGVWLTLI